MPTFTAIARFSPGDQVYLTFDAGEFVASFPAYVVAVSFSRNGKVTYDLDLDIGGETLRNVDSTFITDITQ